MDPKDYRHINIRKEGTVFVVSFRDNKILDDLVIENIAQDLYRLAGDDEVTNLLLNFSAVGYLGMSMLGKLVILQKKMRDKDGRLKLCGMQPSVL